MSARIVPRAAFKQTRWVLQRRAESTTSKAADVASSGATKAKGGASDAASKAQQGLSRVTASAGTALSSAASAAGKAVSGVGGRTGAAINFVQGLVPPTVYYARVAGELGKILVQGRNLYPPTIQTVQSYLTPLQNALRNPSGLLSRSSEVAQAATSTAQNAATNPQALLARLRNLDRATLTSAGVVTAEVIGFFSVGEIIGRFHIVGYRGQHGEHH